MMYNSGANAPREEFVCEMQIEFSAVIAREKRAIQYSRDVSA